MLLDKKYPIIKCEQMQTVLSNINYTIYKNTGKLKHKVLSYIYLNPYPPNSHTPGLSYDGEETYPKYPWT